MNHTDAAALLWRRRWLALLCLVATAAGAVLAGYRLVDDRLVPRFPPLFESVAVVSLVPVVADAASPVPALPAAPATTMPPVASEALDAGGLQSAAKSLEVVVGSPGFADRMHRAAPASSGASLDVEVAPNTNVLRLIASADTPEAARAAVDTAVAELAPAIERYTDAAAVRFPLRANLVDGPSRPTSVPSMKSPVVATVAALAGLLLTWSLLVVVDGLHARRRQTVPVRPDDAAVGAGAPAPAPALTSN